MARSIVVTSGKGGVGKTTLVANLGRALSALGNRVVLFDTDVGLNNLDVIMDIENKVTFDLLDVIENRCRLRQALVEDVESSNLFVLPSAHGYTANLTGQNIKAVINALSPKFDYILVDCPAGIEAGFHRAVQACNEAIVVTTPHITALRDADKVMALIRDYRISPVNLVVNRARGDLILTSDMIDAQDIASLLKVRPIGILPEDDNINLLSNLGLTLNSKTEGFKAIECLAKNLHYGTDILYDVTKKYRGIFGGLKRSFAKK